MIAAASVTSCREYVRNDSNHQTGRLVWCVRVFLSPTSHGAGLQPRADKKQQMKRRVTWRIDALFAHGLDGPRTEVAGGFKGFYNHARYLWQVLQYLIS